MTHAISNAMNKPITSLAQLNDACAQISQEVAVAGQLGGRKVKKGPSESKDQLLSKELGLIFSNKQVVTSGNNSQKVRFLQIATELSTALKSEGKEPVELEALMKNIAESLPTTYVKTLEKIDHSLAQRLSLVRGYNSLVAKLPNIVAHGTDKEKTNFMVRLRSLVASCPPREHQAELSHLIAMSSQIKFQNPTILNVNLLAFSRGALQLTDEDVLLLTNFLSTNLKLIAESSPEVKREFLETLKKMRVNPLAADSASENSPATGRRMAFESLKEAIERSLSKPDAAETTPEVKETPKVDLKLYGRVKKLAKVGSIVAKVALIVAAVASYVLVAAVMPTLGVGLIFYAKSIATASALGMKAPGAFGALLGGVYAFMFGVPGGGVGAGFLAYAVHAQAIPAILRGNMFSKVAINNRELFDKFTVQDALYHAMRPKVVVQKFAELKPLFDSAKAEFTQIAEVCNGEMANLQVQEKKLDEHRSQAITGLEKQYKAGKRANARLLSRGTIDVEECNKRNKELNGAKKAQEAIVEASYSKANGIIREHRAFFSEKYLEAQTKFEKQAAVYVDQIDTLTLPAQLKDNYERDIQALAKSKNPPDKFPSFDEWKERLNGKYQDFLQAYTTAKTAWENDRHKRGPKPADHPPTFADWVAAQAPT